MVHRVLFKQNLVTKDFVTNVAFALLYPVRVAHMIEERAFGWTTFRAFMTLESFSFDLSDPMDVFFVHSITDG